MEWTTLLSAPSFNTGANLSWLHLARQTHHRVSTFVTLEIVTMEFWLEILATAFQRTQRAQWSGPLQVRSWVYVLCVSS